MIGHGNVILFHVDTKKIDRKIGIYQIFYFSQDCSKCIDRYCENNLRQR